MHSDPCRRTSGYEEFDHLSDGALRRIRLAADWVTGNQIADALDETRSKTAAALDRLTELRLIACRRDAEGQQTYLTTERANQLAAAAPPLTAEINGRSFVLFPMRDPLPALRADLQKRGFTNEVFRGISKPHGRQRVTKTGLFYRNAKNGQLVPAVVL